MANLIYSISTQKKEKNKTGKATVFIRIFLFLLLLTATGSLKAQLTGTKNIPGDYTDLASAIVDLNTQGVGAGGVTLNLVASNPQTAPAGGYVIGNTGSLVLTTTSAANPVIIEGNGNTVTASGAQTVGALNDAIFKLIGADWITIQDFTMQENAANTTTAVATNNMTEWCVALLYVATTDGAQNNTIKNNTISLNRTYANTFGIYSNVRHSAAAVTTTADIANNTTAPNSNNKVYGNKISNVNVGVCFVGSGVAANMDVNNDIGGSSLTTSDTITNWGGLAVVSAYVSVSVSGTMGMYLNHQTSLNVSYNSLTSAAALATTISRGILSDFTIAAPTGTFTNSITNNTITITATNAVTTFECIRQFNSFGGAVGTVTVNINSNNILNCTISGGATSGSIVGINNSFACGTLNINNNIIRSNSTTATTGGFTGILNSGAIVTANNINNNQIGNASGGAVTLSAITSGVVVGISNTAGAAATCALSITGNNFQGFSYGTASTGAFQCIISSAAVLSENINTNNFNNLTINSSASVLGFLIAATNATPTVMINGNFITTQYTNSTSTGGANYLAICNNGGAPSSGSSTISNNTFSNMSFKTTTGFASMVYWPVGTGAASTHNINVTGNTFSNIANTGVGTSTQAASMYGILFGVGSTNVVSNNTVSFLSAAGGTVLGIFSSTVSGNPAGSVTINNNSIHDLSTTSTLGASSAGSAQGIQIQGGPATTNGNKIFRNTIYNITANQGEAFGVYVSQATASSVTNIYNNLIGKLTAPNSVYYQGVGGIFIINAVVNTVNCYYNTVYLDGSCAGYTYCAYANSNNPNVNFINNIFVNNVVGTGALEQMVYYRPNLTAQYLTTSNNNIVWSGGSGALSILYAEGTAGSYVNKQATLAAFKSYVGPTRESNSQFELSPFITTNGSLANFLKITGTSQSFAESGGQSIAFTTDDFTTNAIRTGYPKPAQTNGGGTAPDIGAYEYDGAPVLLNDMKATAFISPLNGGTVATSSSFTPQASFTNAGLNTQTAVTVRYKIIDASNVEVYNQTAVIASITSAATTTVSFPATSISPAGTYTIRAFAELAGDQNTGNDSISGTLYVLDPLCGIYHVGSAQSGPFNTLTNAIGALNAVGVSCAVTYLLDDASYSGSETFPLTITAYPGVSSVNTFTMKPNSGATVNVSGSSSPLLNILGSYITIDGSNNGSTSRDLTITNGGANVINMGSTGVTPFTNDSIKNTVLINGSQSSSAVILGDAATIGNPGYFNSIGLINNSIQKAFIGIFAVANSASGLTISNNDLNTSGANAIRRIGIYVQGVDGGMVSGNNIANFESASAELDDGIWLASGTLNMTVSGNNISNLNYTGASGSTTAYDVGILLSPISATANINVTGNTISGLASNGITTSTDDAITGIRVQGASGGIIIQNNKINNIKNTNTGDYGANGIQLYSSLTTANITVNNNFIWDVAAVGINEALAYDNGYGIVVNLGGGYNIWYNSVALTTNQTTTTGLPAAILITSAITTAGSIDLRNNIFSNTQTVGTNRYAIYCGAAANVFSFIDNNDYFVGTAPNIGNLGGVNRANLAAWKAVTGSDVNSLSVDPLFQSTTNLHLQNASTLDCKAATGTGIATDIDGDTRSTSNPDIGADEFCGNPALFPAIVSVSCNGAGNGSVTIPASSCSSPFTYLWSTGATSSAISGLTPATYSVTVTNSCASAASASAMVTEPAVLSAGNSSIGLSCNGSSNGSVTVTASGGTLPYSGTGTFTGLASGSYTYIVTDASGCTATTSATLTQPTAISANASVHNNVSCFGGSNGSAAVTASGGSSPYSYIWSNGASTSDISSLSVGGYFVTVSDSHGCTAATNVELTQPSAPLLASASSNTPVCAGSSINLSSTVSGGTVAYNYSWTGPAGFSSTNPNPPVAGATTANSGTYSLTVTDAHGCTATATTAVTVNNCVTPLDLKLYTQGYYVGSGVMQPVLMNEGVCGVCSTKVDTIIVDVRSASSPYGVVESVKTVLNIDGTALATFSFAVAGNSYYIAIHHRNTIQTWSKLPYPFLAFGNSYDFSTAANKAFGDNMFFESDANLWAFYTGDVNQDENIDLIDFPPLDFGINNGLFGYYATDLNGDGNVDLLDFPILDANINAGIFSRHP